MIFNLKFTGFAKFKGLLTSEVVQDGPWPSQKNNQTNKTNKQRKNKTKLKLKQKQIKTGLLAKCQHNLRKAIGI